MMQMIMLLIKYEGLDQTRKAHLARRQPGKKSTRGSTTYFDHHDYDDHDDHNNDEHDDDEVAVVSTWQFDIFDDYNDDVDDDGNLDDNDKVNYNYSDVNDDNDDDYDDDDHQFDHVDSGQDNPVAQPCQVVLLGVDNDADDVKDDDDYDAYDVDDDGNGDDGDDKDQANVLMNFTGTPKQFCIVGLPLFEAGYRIGVFYT